MCAGIPINNSSCETNEETNRILHTVFVIHSEDNLIILFHKRFLGIQPIVLCYALYFREIRN